MVANYTYKISSKCTDFITTPTVRQQRSSDVVKCLMQHTPAIASNPYVVAQVLDIFDHVTPSDLPGTIRQLQLYGQPQSLPLPNVLQTNWQVLKTLSKLPNDRIQIPDANNEDLKVAKTQLTTSRQRS